MAMATIAANGVPVQGQISTPDTFDLHSVSLTAGEPYVFIARGATEDAGTLADPSMKIGNLDTSGSFMPIGSSPDGPLTSGSTKIDPIMSFIPPTAGTYVIAVGSDVPQGTGTYALAVTPNGSLPPSFSDYQSI